MKNTYHNSGYFLKETKTIIKTGLLSNVLSLFSTGLIFFILAMIISGWWVSSRVVDVLQQEAEVNVYFNESMGDEAAMQMADSIALIDGVKGTRLVAKEEAYGRMEGILGKDAEVLELFNDNPFSPFIEVNIDLEKMDPILKEISSVDGVDYVRDNREVLDRIRSISAILSLLGYLIIAAVGVSTLVIISHIIRLGINSNKEQINTLKLLGAPDTFISLPFLLEGLVLTLGGGILAAVLSVLVISYVYGSISGPLPFIPLPPADELIPGLVAIIVGLSAALGIVGSLFGLSSAKEK